MILQRCFDLWLISLLVQRTAGLLEMIIYNVFRWNNGFFSIFFSQKDLFLPPKSQFDHMYRHICTLQIFLEKSQICIFKVKIFTKNTTFIYLCSCMLYWSVRHVVYCTNGEMTSHLLFNVELSLNNLEDMRLCWHVCRWCLPCVDANLYRYGTIPSDNHREFILY